MRPIYTALNKAELGSVRTLLTLQYNIRHLSTQLKPIYTALNKAELVPSNVTDITIQQKTFTYTYEAYIYGFD